MISIETVIREILSAMDERIQLQEGNPERLPFREVHRQVWATVKKVGSDYYAAHQGPDALKQLLDVMDMQDKRESLEFHISADAAQALWEAAVQVGEEYLTELKSKDAGGALNSESYFKQRAKTLGEHLKKAGCTLSHSQVLHALSKAEGFSSFQALRFELSSNSGTPNYCPHCGAIGTLEDIGSVFCEQGEFDGKEYEAEGDATHYQCSRCTNQFADWSSDRA